MIINAMKARLSKWRAKIDVDFRPGIPWGNSLAQRFLDCLAANLTFVEKTWQETDYKTFVRASIGFARSWMPAPWYAKPFVGVALSALEAWMLANEATLRDKIGDGNPMEGI